MGRIWREWVEERAEIFENNLREERSVDCGELKEEVRKNLLARACATGAEAADGGGGEGGRGSELGEESVNLVNSQGADAAIDILRQILDNARLLNGPELTSDEASSSACTSLPRQPHVSDVFHSRSLAPLPSGWVDTR